MLDLYTAGAFASDATDPRNLFHERALHEARIATEYREIADAQPLTTSFVARIRAAIGGRGDEPTAQACPCPA